MKKSNKWKTRKLTSQRKNDRIAIMAYIVVSVIIALIVAKFLGII